MIFQITEPVHSWMNALQNTGKNSIRLSHAALISWHFLITRFFQKLLQHFLYFIQNQQVMTALFSVVS
jgi:hypothetical protein